MNDIGSIAAAGINVAGTLAVTGVAANMINQQTKNLRGTKSTPKGYLKTKTKTGGKKVFNFSKSMKSKSMKTKFY